MGFSTKDLMKDIEKNVRTEVKQLLQKKLKPFQSEISKEGATVRIIEKSDLENPFVVSITGASEELKAKIQKALK